MTIYVLPISHTRYSELLSLAIGRMPDVGCNVVPEGTLHRDIGWEGDPTLPVYIMNEIVMPNDDLHKVYRPAKGDGQRFSTLA